MPATKKKKTKKAAPRFKNRGDTKFSLTINDNKLHDILREECDLGGTQKMSGETKPQDLIDTYRAVLFFMWGIPLDEPIDKDFLKSARKALRRMKKEDPELFE